MRVENRKLIPTETVGNIKDFWLKMGVFTIRGTIIGLIADILVDAYIYWEN